MDKDGSGSMSFMEFSDQVVNLAAYPKLALISFHIYSLNLYVNRLSFQLCCTKYALLSPFRACPIFQEIQDADIFFLLDCGKNMPPT
jgi:hypothetical protein